MTTVGELKAFIDGMDIPEGEAPTPKQWSRLIERLEQVEANQILDLLGARRDGTVPYIGSQPTFTGYTTCSSLKAVAS